MEYQVIFNVLMDQADGMERFLEDREFESSADLIVITNEDGTSEQTEVTVDCQNTEELYLLAGMLKMFERTN